MKKRARAEAKRKSMEEAALNERLQANQTYAATNFNQYLHNEQHEDVMKVFEKSDLTQVLNLNDRPNIDTVMMTPEEKKARDLAEKRKKKEEERALKKK